MNERLVLADRVVDLARGVVHGPGPREEELTTKEVQLLAFLAGRPGVVVDRDQLLTDVSGLPPDRGHPRGRQHGAEAPGQDRGGSSRPGPPRHGVRRGLPVRSLGPGAAAPEPPARGPAGPGGRADRPRRRGPRLARREPVPRARRARRGWARRRSRVASRSRDRLSWWCGLDGVRGVRDLRERVSVAIDATDARLDRALAEAGPALVVLDAADELEPDAEAHVEAWLAAAPALAVLATARRRRLDRFATVAEVPPLDPEPAEALLRRHVARVRPGRPLADDEARALLLRLDGWPLAIEVAAARLRVLSADELSERLRRSPAGLTGLDATLARRNRRARSARPPGAGRLRGVRGAVRAGRGGGRVRRPRRARRLARPRQSQPAARDGRRPPPAPRRRPRGRGADPARERRRGPAQAAPRGLVRAGGRDVRRPPVRRARQRIRDAWDDLRAAHTFALRADPEAAAPSRARARPRPRPARPARAAHRAARRDAGRASARGAGARGPAGAARGEGAGRARRGRRAGGAGRGGGGGRGSRRARGVRPVDGPAPAPPRAPGRGGGLRPAARWTSCPRATCRTSGRGPRWRSAAPCPTRAGSTRPPRPCGSPRRSAARPTIRRRRARRCGGSACSRILRGRPHDGEVHLQAALARCPDEPRVALDVELVLAQGAVDRGDLELARVLVERLGPRVVRFGDAEREGIVWSVRADLALARLDWTTAEAALRRHLELARTLPGQAVYAATNLGILHRLEGRTAAALDELVAARARAREMGAQALAARVTLEIAAARADLDDAYGAADELAGATDDDPSAALARAHLALARARMRGRRGAGAVGGAGARGGAVGGARVRHDARGAALPAHRRRLSLLGSRYGRRSWASSADRVLERRRGPAPRTRRAPRRRAPPGPGRRPCGRAAP